MQYARDKYQFDVNQLAYDDMQFRSNAVSLKFRFEEAVVASLSHDKAELGKKHAQPLAMLYEKIMSYDLTVDQHRSTEV